jgi:hypothetical protein
MVGFWIRAGAAGLKAIKGVKPGKKFKGQKTKEAIVEAGKKKKEKIVDEDFKKNFRRYFTNQPPKKTKTKVKHYTAPKDFTW